MSPRDPSRRPDPAGGHALLEADFVVTRRTFDVSAQLTLAPGQRLSLFGASGAGKTTILEAIAGSVALRRGVVRLAGQTVNAPVVSWRRRGAASEGSAETPSRGEHLGRTASGGSAETPSRASLHPVAMRRRGIAVVRQPTTVFPHLRVRQNVAYGLHDRQGVAEILALVGLGELGEAMPTMLSGGQRQRVCLARALARPFRALLLDEPFSAIDVSSRASLRDVALDVVNRQEAVALLVTHDLTEAQAFGHQIAIVDEGRLLQVGDADQLVRQPATTRVAELCGYTSFVEHGDSQWALHPDRFVEGAQPERGVVLSGMVAGVHAFGSRFTCDLVVAPAPGQVNAAGTSSISVHVDSPPEVGIQWVVTAVDPPLVSRVRRAEDEEG